MSANATATARIADRVKSVPDAERGHRLRLRALYVLGLPPTSPSLSMASITTSCQPSIVLFRQSITSCGRLGLGKSREVKDDIPLEPVACEESAPQLSFVRRLSLGRHPKKYSPRKPSVQIRIIAVLCRTMPDWGYVLGRKTG